MRSLLIALSLCCLLGHVIGQDAEQPEQASNAWLRFAHGWSQGAPVDVYIDNLPTASWNWIAFRGITAYKPILTGEHSITLVRANATRMEPQGQQQEDLQPISNFFSSDDILLNAMFNLGNDEYYSFAWFAAQNGQAQNDQQGQEGQEGQENSQKRQEEQQLDQLEEGLRQSTNSWALYLDRSEVMMDVARLRFIHLISEFPSVSIFLERMDEQNGEQQQDAQKRQQLQLFAENLGFPDSSSYMSLQPGLYSFIFRSSAQNQTEQNGQQQRQQEEGQEIGRVDNIELLAGNIYSSWILGPLQEQEQENQLAVIFKFDNFELLRMQGQQQGGEQQNQ